MRQNSGGAGNDLYFVLRYSFSDIYMEKCIWLSLRIVYSLHVRHSNCYVWYSFIKTFLKYLNFRMSFRIFFLINSGLYYWGNNIPEKLRKFILLN